jgi:hypothetical protein
VIGPNPTRHEAPQVVVERTAQTIGRGLRHRQQLGVVAIVQVNLESTSQDRIPRIYNRHRLVSPVVVKITLPATTPYFSRRGS